MRSLLRLIGTGLVVSLCLSGCRSSVASVSNEKAANEILVALERARVPASRAKRGELIEIEVASDDVARAVNALSEQRLPSDRAPGLQEVYGQPGLIPSPTEERARLLLATSGELAGSLKAIDGIVDARVHLALPPDAMELVADANSRRSPRASVLIVFDGNTSPIAVSEIQRLVAGGVADMTPEAVSVVVRRLNPATASTATFAHVGPFAVAASSAGALRAALVTMLLLNLGLAAGLAMIFSRKRGSESAPPISIG